MSLFLVLSYSIIMLPRRGNQCFKAHCCSERLQREVGSTQLWGVSAQPGEVHAENKHWADGHTGRDLWLWRRRQNNEGSCTYMSTWKSSIARSVMKSVPHERTSTPSPVHDCNADVHPGTLGQPSTPVGWAGPPSSFRPTWLETRVGIRKVNFLGPETHWYWFRL